MAGQGGIAPFGGGHRVGCGETGARDGLPQTRQLTSLDDRQAWWGLNESPLDTSDGVG